MFVSDCAEGACRADSLIDLLSRFSCASWLREAYRPALISIKKLGVKYLVEDYEDRGKEIAAAVQAERQELRAQNLDPDRVFAKRREERAEALAAR